MNNQTCHICQKTIGNAYSLKLVKEGEQFHTCSYDCNMRMNDEFGEGFWKFVINKSDFINPCTTNSSNTNPFIVNDNVYTSKFDYDQYDFENMDPKLIMDSERYESLYKIYLENKRIDEILDVSESSSADYSDDY